MPKLYNFILYLYAFALPFEQWDPFGLGGSVSIIRVLAIIYFIASAVSIKTFSSLQNSVKQAYILFLLLVEMILVNLFMGVNLPVKGDIVNLAFLQNIILFILLVNHIKQDKIIFYKALFYYVLGIILLGVLFYFNIGIVFRGDRISIFGDNPNNQGTKVAVGIFIIIVYALKDYLKLGVWRYILLLSIPVLFSFLLETGSRGAILTFLASGLLLLMLFPSKESWRKGVIIVAGMTLIGYSYNLVMGDSVLGKRMVEFEEEGSLGGREYIWMHVLDIYQNSIVFGVGEAGYRYEIFKILGSEKSPHNYFLYILVTGGLVGFLLFVIFIFRIFKYSLYNFSKYKNFLEVILLIICVFAMFRSGGSLGDKFYWFIFALIIGHHLNIRNNEKNYYSNSSY